MSTQKLNTIVAWLIFTITLGVFVVTMSPTIAFWDSGEFVTCSAIMGIPHPPGAPLLSLAGRVMSILPIPDLWGAGSGSIAYRINLINVFAGAFAAFFFFHVIVGLIARLRSLDGSAAHDWPVTLGASVATLAVAFSHQYWENAVETETYMSSILLSILSVWLVFRWEDRKNEPASVRYLFLASYLVGLGNGIHLYVLLIAPTLALLVFFARRDWFADGRFFFGLAGLLVAAFVVRLAGGKGLFYALAILFAAIGPAILYAMWRKERFGWKMVLIGVVLSGALYAAGYSVYPTIMVRAAKNPSINEGDPDTWPRFRDYVERKQFGQGNMYTGMLDRNAPPSYQFGYMYFRYLLQHMPKWGPSPSMTFTNNRSADFPGIEVDMSEDVPVSLLLWCVLLFGMALHLRRDSRRFVPFLLYFLAAGIGLVLYLDMANPEVRERDYFFVGSFFIMYIWLGIGVTGLLDLITHAMGKKNRKTAVGLTAACGLVFATIIPASLLSDHLDPGNSQYHVHDRSHNTIPLDYGRNILEFVAPDAILFTNGDNDTFPVWYAHEVLGIREDVTIVNLSLLNAPWYIKQLRDNAPKVPITLSDEFIDTRLTGDPAVARQTLKWSAGPSRVTMAGMTWDMPPYYPGAPGGDVAFLSVATFMTAHIIKTNNWRRPMYFAVTVDPRLHIGLGNYLRTEGMAFRLTETSGSGHYKYNIPALEKNVYERYIFDGITDPAIYKDSETAKLLRNYFVGFADLCIAHFMQGNKDGALKAARAGIENGTADLLRRILLYQMLHDHGLPEEAARMVDDEIAALDLDDIASVVVFGTRCLENDFSAGAVQAFDALVNRHPDSVLAWKAYTEALYRNRRFEDTAKALDTLIMLVPDDQEVRRFKAMLDSQLDGNRP